MIKQSELRLGDWVFDSLTKKPFKIQDAFEIHYLSESFEPIAITPEILEKCGFEKNSYNIYSKQFTDEIDWSMTFEDDEIVLQYCNYNYTLLKGKNIKYLHQLQNLYFALTGEELEVSLSALAY